MSIRFHFLVAVTGAAVVLAACENGSSQPVSPSTVDIAPSSAVVGNAPSSAVAARPAPSAAKAAAQHVVTLFDACDPETFNAALGAGSCSRSGGVRFATFLEQLGKHGSVGPWHMTPAEVTMTVGQMLVATNKGGETHTFTEVDEFGGGIVDQLNQLSGLTTVAPECSALKGPDFLAPGTSSKEEEEEAGVEKYQCCIHPWMRAEVRITQK
jgi:plastocyanin